MASGNYNALAHASLAAEPGRLAVRGAMTFATVSALYSDSLASAGTADGPLTIDLGEVDRADSAGMALIVEWYRLAKAAGRPVSLANPSDQVTRLIKVSGLENILR